jgi:hypothetical protein
MREILAGEFSKLLWHLSQALPLHAVRQPQDRVRGGPPGQVAPWPLVQALYGDCGQSRTGPRDHRRLASTPPARPSGTDSAKPMACFWRPSGTRPSSSRRATDPRSSRWARSLPACRSSEPCRRNRSALRLTSNSTDVFPTWPCRIGRGVSSEPISGPLAPARAPTRGSIWARCHQNYKGSQLQGRATGALPPKFRPVFSKPLWHLLRRFQTSLVPSAWTFNS